MSSERERHRKRYENIRFAYFSQAAAAAASSQLIKCISLSVSLDTRTETSGIYSSRPQEISAEPVGMGHVYNRS